MSVPVKIVVVYHSGYGHTLKIAEAVARGAAGINGASVELFTADEAPGRWELLDNSDAIIMGAPHSHGQPVSAVAFMDATSHLQYAEKRRRAKSRQASPMARPAGATHLAAFAAFDAARFPNRPVSF